MGAYGQGLYGVGGYGVATVDGPPLPDPIPYERRPVPTHLLGIGPANYTVPWRGAPNHGVTGGKIQRPSQPVMLMPEAQSKSYTLRLDGACEARTDHTISRNKAIVIEELTTDCWWFRKDPDTGFVEDINRFNAAKVDISSTGTQLTLSATWQDYRAQVEDRLISAYYNTTTNTSVFAAGTLVTDVLRYVIPSDMYLNRTNVLVGTAAPLGTITEQFTVQIGSRVGDVMTSLRAISTTPWEWWVSMGTLLSDAPVLSFSATGRGSDKGVKLVDVDGVHGPITAWTMRASSDQYANALFLTAGDDFGVWTTDPDSIAMYGRRETSMSDTTNPATAASKQALGNLANLKLALLTDRTPSFNVTLRQGFWQGRAHIDIGDWLGLTIRLGAELIEVRERVQQLSVEIDASGAETVTLTLGAPMIAKDPRSRFSLIPKLVHTMNLMVGKGNAP